ncbi:MAG: hypothetical protein WDN08_07805 [Rhizomicrobium sp.]
MLAEAVLWLALARAALLFVPFRTLAAWFGTVTQPAAVSRRGAGPAAPAAGRRPARSAGR